MINKLKERRAILADEHAKLLEGYNVSRETIDATKTKLSMLVGHVSELDFQIKQLESNQEEKEISDE